MVAHPNNKFPFLGLAGLLTASFFSYHGRDLLPGLYIYNVLDSPWRRINGFHKRVKHQLLFGIVSTKVSSFRI